MAPAPKHSPEKQQELILDAAIEAIQDTSITDFTMAKIARTAGLSMGSIYKFVQSKEDIILALACQSFDHFSDAFEKVLNLPLTMPEKILAISLISSKKVQLFEFDYELQSYATNEAVIRRASPMWTAKVIEGVERCEKRFRESMSEEIAAGELKDVPNLCEIVEEINVASWAMTVGYEQVIRIQQTKNIVDGTDSLLAPLSFNDPMIRSLIRLLNSYPWQKLIDDESLNKIEEELTKLQLR